MNSQSPIGLLACFGLVFLSVGSVDAHDSWLITENSSANEGDKVWLSFVTGEVFPYGDGATRPDRVDRFTDRVGSQEMAVVGFGPQDKGLSVRHLIEGKGLHVIGCALKPRLIEMVPEKFERYLTSEDATAALARFLASRRQAPDEMVIVEEYTKFAKTMIEVVPADGDGGFMQPLGHRLEIIPLSNPCHWRAGETVRIKVLLDGHPWSDIPISVGREGSTAGVPVPEAKAAAPEPEKPAVPQSVVPVVTNERSPEMVRRSGPFSVAAKERPAVGKTEKVVEAPPAKVEPPTPAVPQPVPQSSDAAHHYVFQTRTDASGVASITLDKPGHGFIKAHFIRPTTGLSRAKWESYWASLTYRVIGASNLNSGLQSIRGLRGDLTPGSVLGYRMGLAAMERLGMRRGDESLLISHSCPLKPEYTSVLDGLQAATGATFGRLNLRLEPVDSIDQMRTVFVDRASRRVVTMHCPDAVVSSMNPADAFEIEATALRLATMSEEMLFAEEADDTAVARKAGSREVIAASTEPVRLEAVETDASGFDDRAVGLKSRRDSIVDDLSR